MNEYRKSKKILVLAIIFFISGLTFFYLRVGGLDKDDLDNKFGKVELSHPKNNDPDGDIILKDMPPPDKFQTFVYSKGEKIEVDFVCKDKYATALIYQDGVDYRYNPLGSKFNTAFICDSNGNLEQIINLETLNLEEKKEYYIVRADQGEKNGWYNPY